ncbi:MAG: hypothetical protein FWB93_02095 [Oscillospiraceae bacterium]|nr:hypothetical protein [Oscillospiraceae bacterium]
MNNQNPNRQNQRLQNNQVERSGQNSVKKQKAQRTPQNKTGQTAVVKKDNNRQVKVAETRALVRASAPRIRTVRKDTPNKPLPVAMMFLAVVCTVLVIFMLTNFMEINEHNQDLRRMTNRINELQTRESQLVIDAGRVINWAELEELAMSLGMTSSENLLPPIQIASEVEDEIRNYETEDDDANIVSTVLTALGNNAASFWNIIVGGE